MINKSQEKKHFEIEKLKREIGKRIAKIRNTSETKKQRAFTAKIGISQSQISAIERGRSTLSINVVKQIMQLRIDGARINIDWLFTGEGPMLVYETLDNKNINGSLLNRLSHLDQKKKETIIKVIDSYLE